MVELKSYVEMAEDISKMERVMSNLFHYSRARGGGILWAIIYWLLYFFSIYEISNISHGLPNLLELIGFTALFVIGCFLIYAVSWQISTFNRWHKQQYNDYEAMIQKNAQSLFESLHKNATMGYGGYDKDVEYLQNALSNFRRKYFPFKSED